MTNAAACRIDNNSSAAPEWGPRLPKNACLPINRCNLPAAILGGLTFQRHPASLLLDGVAELHADLFPLLERLPDPAERARRFMDYMTVHFRLEALEEAGLMPDRLTDSRRDRPGCAGGRIICGWCAAGPSIPTAGKALY